MKLNRGNISYGQLNIGRLETETVRDFLGQVLGETVVERDNVDAWQT